MTGPVHLGVHPTGMRQRVDSGRVQAAEERLRMDVAHAEQAGAHLWMVMVGHTISPMLAARLADGSTEEPNLDAETIATVSIGCFRCEEPLTPKRVRQPCPGDPA